MFKSKPFFDKQWQNTIFCVQPVIWSIYFCIVGNFIIQNVTQCTLKVSVFKHGIPTMT